MLRHALPLFFHTLLGSILAVPAETLPSTPAELQPVPSVVNYLRAHTLPASIALAPSDAEPQIGDEVIYLLGVQNPTGINQWLVRLKFAANDAKVRLPDNVVYTSTGHEFRYTHQSATLDIAFIGPFRTQTAVRERRGRVIVSAESLQLGMQGYAESAVDIAARLKQAGIEEPMFFGGEKPPTAEVVAAGKKAAAAFGLTANEERLGIGVYFALRAFYAAVTDIPAAREVIEQVIDKPSLWSIAGNRGVNMDFEYGWQDVQVLPPDTYALDAPVYLLPVRLSLNGHPALQAGLAVTTTRPPLRNCAGIVGLALQHPTDPTRRVFLRVLGGRATVR